MTIQDTPNVTQNGLGVIPGMGFEYFEDNSRRVKLLLAELAGLGVVLRIEVDRLAYDAPAGVITDDLLGRMRADRDGLIETLRATAGDGDHVDDQGDPVVTSIRCPFCGEIDLADDPDGLRCGSCRSLAWVPTAEGGLARCDVADSVIELIDPDSVPICPSCGRWCDVMTWAESWRCSRCDPEADERRRRTVRVLALVSRSRGRSVPSVRCELDKT